MSDLSLSTPASSCSSTVRGISGYFSRISRWNSSLRSDRSSRRYERLIAFHSAISSPDPTALNHDGIQTFPAPDNCSRRFSNLSTFVNASSPHSPQAARFFSREGLTFHARPREPTCRLDCEPLKPDADRAYPPEPIGPDPLAAASNSPSLRRDRMTSEDLTCPPMGPPCEQKQPGGS